MKVDSNSSPRGKEEEFKPPKESFSLALTLPPTELNLDLGGRCFDKIVNFSICHRGRKEGKIQSTFSSPPPKKKKKVERS